MTLKKATYIVECGKLNMRVNFYTHCKNCRFYANHIVLERADVPELFLNCVCPDEYVEGQPAKSEISDQEKYVYFLLAPESKKVKIGSSNDPKKRMTSIQIGSPEKLELIGFMKGGSKGEESLHRKFKDYNVSGEWFEYSGEVEKYILGLNNLLKTEKGTESIN